MSDEINAQSFFSLQGQTAVITGGSGGLGRAMALGLARAGAKVAVIGFHEEKARAVAAEIHALDGQALGIGCNVVERDEVLAAAKRVTEALGPVDILVNCAGGNQPAATTSSERSFFELDSKAIDDVFTLNLMGTILCCQIFGRGMAERKQGNIVNIASMASLRPLTRIPAYDAAKAAVVNFTQWLAVHLAQEYSPALRVNAIAPGFFVTEQNRFLLTDVKNGGYTARGKTIIDHTPMQRMGEADDLVSTLLWLVSPASKFVTGIIVPVDGGFSAFSGV
jgi:Dehydrogenases with different specificities (related to short-chain alcohol dehydrogenases)